MSPKVPVLFNQDGLGFCSPELVNYLLFKCARKLGQIGADWLLAYTCPFPCPAHLNWTVPAVWQETIEHLDDRRTKRWLLSLIQDVCVNACSIGLAFIRRPISDRPLNIYLNYLFSKSCDIRYRQVRPAGQTWPDQTDQVILLVVLYFLIKIKSCLSKVKVLQMKTSSSLSSNKCK